MSRFRTILALAATAALWASAFPAIRVGLDGYGVAGLTFLRLAVASSALAAAAPLMGVRLPRSRDLPLILLCAASGMAGYQLLLNWGEVHVPAGTASLLIATAPVFSVLLAIAFLGERLTTPVVAGSLIAVAGAAVIALAGGDTRFSTAAWIVLAAAVLQGVYHFASKPLLARYTALEVVAYSTWVGTVLALPLAPAAVRSLATAPPAATTAAVFLGLLPSALGFVVWGYAVARSSVTTATSVLYLVPVIALAVSFAWLGEVPTVAAIIGGALAVIGVVVTRLHGAAKTSTRTRGGGVTEAAVDR